MTTTLIKGTESGKDRVLRLPSSEAYKIWYGHYEIYLKRLYKLFQIACEDNNVDWDHHINLETFCAYVYKNSNKYLSPWT